MRQRAAVTEAANAAVVVPLAAVAVLGAHAGGQQAAGSLRGDIHHQGIVLSPGTSRAPLIIFQIEFAD